ncbi:MAG: aldehyde ferredoxin oxidoreductase, partial [Clostridia bacterium]|nr:aldehyde ferredoxin oxidoreductase [Clostridia bacterium]
KNNPYPAHMPQVKKNLAVHYAINEHGADHCTAGHDPMMDVGGFQGAGATNNYKQGLYEPLPYRQLTEEKMKFNYYPHIQRATNTGLGVCNFAYGPGSLYDIEDIVGMVNDITGWSTNWWEIMKSAERTLVLMRLFNEREGFGAKDDVLPKRMFEQKFSYGPAEGEHVDEEAFYHCRSLYYDMAGLDQEGHARHSKVVELDLQWAEELVRGNK